MVSISSSLEFKNSAKPLIAASRKSVNIESSAPAYHGKEVVTYLPTRLTLGNMSYFVLFYYFRYEITALMPLPVIHEAAKLMVTGFGKKIAKNVCKCFMRQS